jgi:hypothetical protein
MKLLQLVVIVTTSTRNALYEFFTFDLASAKWITHFHFSPYSSLLLGLNKGHYEKEGRYFSSLCFREESECANIFAKPIPFIRIQKTCLNLSSTLLAYDLGISFLREQVFVCPFSLLLCNTKKYSYKKNIKISMHLVQFRFKKLKFYPILIFIWINLNLHIKNNNIEIIFFNIQIYRK